MFRVRNTILSEDIATAKFACDLPKCKGACCVVGDAGAPVSKDEVSKLEKAYKLLKGKLHPQAQKTVEENGVVYETVSGGRRLSCRDNEECVFVSYEDDVAYCAIQHAFIKGDIDWEKPLSCHLYPIRLKKIAGVEYANFDYVEKLCGTACTKGEQEGVYLSEFLKESLIRRYNNSWYNEFKKSCKEIRNKNEGATEV
ncbi:DUF3109 family protein [Fodinibius saliphilus]|uniref:DUF3109 family protein n=1 Tax=Fodinibius saliphilus TaxID=1920650 RepID=UPI0011091CEE|nr:DUF3109 family protein [Fodinibius saliphilus]